MAKEIIAKKKAFMKKALKAVSSKEKGAKKEKEDEDEDEDEDEGEKKNVCSKFSNLMKAVKK
jgi:hypothetical protein